MTRHPHKDGKKLIIGGGIANFTNVATTFKGIVRALKEYQVQLQENQTEIYVRRGGPNYQEGLRVMKAAECVIFIKKAVALSFLFSIYFLLEF